MGATMSLVTNNVTHNVTSCSDNEVTVTSDITIDIINDAASDILMASDQPIKWY